MKDELSIEGRHEIASLLASTAWRNVVRPSLELWMAQCEKEIAQNRTLSLEDVRYKQGCWFILKRLLEEPREILMREE